MSVLRWLVWGIGVIGMFARGAGRGRGVIIWRYWAVVTKNILNL